MKKYFLLIKNGLLPYFKDGIYLTAKHLSDYQYYSTLQPLTRMFNMFISFPLRSVVQPLNFLIARKESNLQPTD